jgi:hypothetical protein
MNYRWVNFDPTNWATQEHPPERKLVLVQSEGGVVDGAIIQAPSVGVGYLRYAAGCKDSPFFVVPGGKRGRDIAWCDCLPEGFGAPLWPGYPVAQLEESEAVRNP